ncbi:MAG TPA: zinc-binding dehydrogenase [Nitrosospira sp.]|nr:zinc-binding dehydrogenase [Nitrosospira sp.]
MLGRLAGRSRADRRFQSASANGGRSLPDLLRQLRVRHAGFPSADVPLQDIAHQVAEGRLKAKPSRVFSFEQIREAHRVMEANVAGGKMVVVLA